MDRFPAGEGFLHGREGEIGFGYQPWIEPVVSGDFGLVRLDPCVFAGCGVKEIQNRVGDVLVVVLVWKTGKVLNVAYGEAHLFPDFPFQRILCDFTIIDESTHNRQFALGGFFGTFNEEHLAFRIQNESRGRDGWIEVVGVFADFTLERDLILWRFWVPALGAMLECEVWLHARANLPQWGGDWQGRSWNWKTLPLILNLDLA